MSFGTQVRKIPFEHMQTITTPSTRAAFHMEQIQAFAAIQHKYCCLTIESQSEGPSQSRKLIRTWFCVYD